MAEPKWQPAHISPCDGSFAASSCGPAVETQPNRTAGTRPDPGEKWGHTSRNAYLCPRVRFAAGFERKISYKYWFVSGQALKPTSPLTPTWPFFPSLHLQPTSASPTSGRRNWWGWCIRRHENWYAITQDLDGNPPINTEFCSLQSWQLSMCGWVMFPSSYTQKVVHFWFLLSNLPLVYHFWLPPAPLAEAAKGNTSSLEGWCPRHVGEGPFRTAPHHPPALWSPTHVASTCGALLCLFEFVCSCFCV